ncbi:MULTISPECIES: HK97 family phage prohead protease [Mycobacterium]|uniref:HK97 family phage prohead protease n=1 Tax=Mycobacterium TaxID=1763 RepID=UPI001EF14C90|nr:MULTISPECIES: HK97 family phage prohead protease [Mycobacterium]BDB44558.1 hypothetical protein IWGMT90018_50040 [Mycobacterium kiyosense]BDE16063.1 hypothetical protein MKCMC460_49230 [Mycobacterium sp. 20KCMC460]GLB93047.1 hypothetical protein SRL2020130_58640 [Mycobacterium kiyosense]GLC04838.1 hypothetical protein SRL2020400_54290 [Mycobacterium kiyosense]GLC11240.1 hypothetical protein SRL2020411_58860 [Mycobacterium kiyosense]
MTSPTLAAAAEVLDVDPQQRHITVIAAPYGQYATVLFRGQPWRETIYPGAFDDAATNPEKIRVCREHNRSDLVGKVVHFDTNDPRGLIAQIRVARTQRGDDTLGLAAERMLSASVGFGVHPGGERLDHATRTRQVLHGWLDHLALVMAPAYDAAQVLAVRATPHLDQLAGDPVFAWAALRTDAIAWARHRTEPR